MKKIAMACAVFGVIAAAGVVYCADEEDKTKTETKGDEKTDEDGVCKPDQDK
ncbi:MAG: hypothetical protein LBB63_01225 [Holosporaceae bacterium]|jgi:hypothetical protein|nr:hypothetical protein [Holosporaceae bacterium]